MGVQYSYSDVRVPHPVNHDLLDHLVPEADLDAAGAEHRHATHVCSGGNSGSKCTNGFIRLLRHFPQVHEVYRFVNSDDCELFHLVEEEVRGDEVGVGAGVEDPLPELSVASCL